MKQHVPTWYVVMVRHFNNNFVRMRLRTSVIARITAIKPSVLVLPSSMIHGSIISVANGLHSMQCGLEHRVVGTIVVIIIVVVVT